MGGKACQKILDRAHHSVVSFYRALNFRRMGASSWFGISTNLNHKCYNVAAMDDFNPPMKAPESDDDELPRLHSATITLSDAECVRLYQAFKSKKLGAEWRQTDNYRNTLLHQAALCRKPQSTTWLLKNIEEFSLSTRNLAGYTPFEALQDQIDVVRTQGRTVSKRIVVSDTFSGCEPHAVDYLCILLRVTANLGDSNANRLRLKLGCKCGKCIEGFLSPRMKLALLTQAGRVYDALDDHTNERDGCRW